MPSTSPTGWCASACWSSPHFPGYPAFIWLARLINLAVDDPALAVQWTSLLGTALAPLAASSRSDCGSGQTCWRRSGCWCWPCRSPRPWRSPACPTGLRSPPGCRAAGLAAAQSSLAGCCSALCWRCVLPLVPGSAAVLCLRDGAAGTRVRFVLRHRAGGDWPACCLSGEYRRLGLFSARGGALAGNRFTLWGQQRQRKRPRRSAAAGRKHLQRSTHPVWPP